MAVFNEGSIILKYGFALCRFVVFVVAMCCATIVFSDGKDQVYMPDDAGSLNDCAEIKIHYRQDDTLTRYEAIASMEDAFYESLSQFDSCQMSRPNVSDGVSAASGGAEDSEGLGEARGAVASPDLSGTDAAVIDGAYDAVAQTVLKDGDNTGGMPAEAEDQDIPDGARVDGAEVPDETRTGVRNGKVPDDIPPADNDSILEAQIRQAAVSETDPEIKQKLWDEYRKYKGLPQPGK